MTKATIDPKRRLLIGAGLTALTPMASLAALIPTPRQTAGPFYPVELPLDDDNNLTQVKGQPGPAEGRIVDLTGRVLNTSGIEMKDVRVEIWQCDARGRYHHPGDRDGSSRDEKFQGHGHTITDKQGRYRFRTIHPVPYPGRTPHIHVAVFLPDKRRPFVSQIYVKGEPRNADDFLFRHVPVEQRHLVLVDFLPVDKTPWSIMKGTFDLIVA